MIPPRKIALSGGGMKGLAHVGALEVLEERGLLRCVKEYIGTSAGAIIGFCIAIGYTLSELRTLCAVFDFSLAQNLDPAIILQFSEQFGIDDGENLERFLNVLLKAKGLPTSLTFQELAQLRPSAPKLRVYAANIETCMPHEFSSDRTPRAELRMAVRASMCIPFLFTPVKDGATGALLVDGGIIAHFPFYHLSDSERADTIGIAFQKDDAQFDMSSMNLSEFSIRVFLSLYKHQNEALYKDWGHQIINVSCKFSGLNFDADTEIKLGIMEAGRKAALEFCSRRTKTSITRRYSVS